VKAHPGFAPVGVVTPVALGAWTGQAGTPMAGAPAATPFAYPIANFYMTDPISRASATMAECTDAFVSGAAPGTGTHG